MIVLFILMFIIGWTLVDGGIKTNNFRYWIIMVAVILAIVWSLFRGT